MGSVWKNNSRKMKKVSKSIVLILLAVILTISSINIVSASTIAEDATAKDPAVESSVDAKTTDEKSEPVSEQLSQEAATTGEETLQSQEEPSAAAKEPEESSVQSATASESITVKPANGSIGTQSTDYTVGIQWTDFTGLLGTTINETTHDLLGKQQNQTIKYSLEFSNSISYEIGEVEIRGPYALYTYRNNFEDSGALAGKGVTFSDIGIAKGTVPNASSAFCYELDEVNNEIVITNRRAISAANTNLMQISYTLNSFMTPDETTWSITPKLTIKGVSQPANTFGTIAGSMDTKVEITELSKKVLGGGYRRPHIFMV